jgi:hypothetical protein
MDAADQSRKISRRDAVVAHECRHDIGCKLDIVRRCSRGGGLISHFRRPEIRLPAPERTPVEKQVDRALACKCRESRGQIEQFTTFSPEQVEFRCPERSLCAMLLLRFTSPGAPTSAKEGGTRRTLHGLYSDCCGCTARFNKRRQPWASASTLCEPRKRSST